MRIESTGERATDIMQVNEWHPADGCNRCKQASKIMHEQTRKLSQEHAIAMKKIREQAMRIVELERMLEVTRKK